MGWWLVALLLIDVTTACADQAMTAAVNALRDSVDLPMLAPNHSLKQAATRHAAYLDQHRTPTGLASATPAGDSAHRQRPGRDGFSGETPAARAVASGYPHKQVLENVSMGYADTAAALDGLMSAIYHRLTFLDFFADEIGAAAGQRSRVFLMGRRGLRAACDDPPGDALFRAPLDCLGQSMTRDHYERLCATLPALARFRPAHPITCPNGVALDAGFMAKVCEQPPRGARFDGAGRYYQPCSDATRIDAAWFDAICRNPPAAATHIDDGRYFLLCEPPQKVSATWFEHHCETLPNDARYRDSNRFQRPCAAEHPLRVEFLTALERTALEQRPALVVWPPPDATDIVPAFFIEEPDPLPDLAVAGNPVSIQVNPAYADEVALTRLALFRLRDETREHIDATRLLDQESDPHGLLSSHEFALFALQRLDWGATYEVVAELLLDGKPERLVWQFSTRAGAARVETVAADWQRFSIRSGEPIWVYLPPREDQPFTVLSSRTTYRRGTAVKVSVIDPNTAEITVVAPHCDRVTVSFESQRVIELVPAGCAG